MQRRTLLAAIGGVTLLGGGALGYELFAPKQATEANEDRTGGTDASSDGDDSTGDDSTGGDSTSDASDAAGGGDDDSTESDDGGAQILKTGEFVGKDNHECSGTVELAADSKGYFLQFRAYEQTQGPDVYCYLTPAPDPDTGSAIDAGTKVLIDGGAEDGQMTKTGTFAQSLPDEADVDGAMGVGVWCDDFSVPFGAATLEDA